MWQAIQCSKQPQIETNLQIWRFPPAKLIKEIASVTLGVVFTFQWSLNGSRAENIGYTMWSKFNEWKVNVNYKMKQKKRERMYLNKEHWYGLREKELISLYYSFKIFPRFWLAKSTRIIHHNQLTDAQIWKNSAFNEPMTSKVQPSCRLMHRQPRRPGDEVELFWLWKEK